MKITATLIALIVAAIILSEVSSPKGPPMPPKITHWPPVDTIK